MTVDCPWSSHGSFQTAVASPMTGLYELIAVLYRETKAMSVGGGGEKRLRKPASPLLLHAANTCTTRTCPDTVGACRWAIRRVAHIVAGSPHGISGTQSRRSFRTIMASDCVKIGIQQS